MTDTSPKKFSDRDSFTHTQVEGALCVWEWMLENRERELLASWFDGLGTSGMRHVSIQAGDICDRTYKHMEEQGYEFIGAYDWEFVPDVCVRLDWQALTEDNQYNGDPYEPDINAIFLAMVAAEKCRQPDPDRRSFSRTTPDLPVIAGYIIACQAAAKKMWGYEGLIDDHPERVQAAFKAQQDVAEFVKALGEKHDLMPVSAW